MRLLEKILLATDFSKSSHKTLKSAIALAKAFQSKIILIHVLPNNIKNEKVRILLNGAAIKKLDIIHQKIIKEGVKTAKPILEYGNHFENIIQTADSNNVNMILIGAGEKLKSDVFQLGTTAAKIIRLSNKPVWVIKNENNLNVRNILCPIDFSKESKRALKNAINMARRIKAELIVFSVYEVHNLEPPNDRLNWDQDNELVLSAHKNEFNLFLKNFDLTDLSWKKEIQIGDPAVEILKALKRYKSDLLIIGTTGKSGLTRILMGSVTEKVIREVPCSFITLKSEDFINLKLETRIRDIQKH
ncbi:universal stress protein [Eudoraea sp.]|uniref:universal stress protein n=1 Tax=Eudoraea sp. TaxID=1979955 RepID=UPI003C768BD1